MKKSTILLLVLSLNLFLFSCKKDKSEDEYSYQFASVEQSKTQLQENGQQMVTQLSTFKDEKSIDAFISFGSLPLPDNMSQGNLALSSVVAISRAALDPTPDKIMTSLKKSAYTNPTTIKQAWDQLKGIYKWNRITKTWDVTASSTDIEFWFPVSKTATDNKAVFTISSYKGSADVTLGDYMGDLPVEIKANLKIDGTQYFSYEYAAQYTSEGIPTAINTSAAFGTFVFAYALTNNSSTIGVNYSFKNGDKVIYDLGFAFNGNFSVDQLDQAEDVQQVLNSANAHFQLFNVKVAGVMDLAKIANAEATIFQNEGQSNFDGFKADSLLAIEINKNAKLIVFFTDTKQKIAEAEAYAYKYKDWAWVPTTTGYTLREITTSDVGFRFNFPDKTSVDQYFASGFATLIRDMNTLITDINTKYGTSLTPVE